jgi:hypothetical protein
MVYGGFLNNRIVLVMVDVQPLIDVTNKVALIDVSVPLYNNVGFGKLDVSPLEKVQCQLAILNESVLLSIKLIASPDCKQVFVAIVKSASILLYCIDIVLE